MNLWWRVTNLVVLPKRPSVAHSEQGDACFSAELVHRTLNVDADCTGALIKDGKLRLVVEKAGHLQKKWQITFSTASAYN